MIELLSGIEELVEVDSVRDEAGNALYHPEALVDALAGVIKGQSVTL